MSQTNRGDEEFVGQNACEQFGADLRDAFAACSRPSFGMPKPARATLKTGLKLALGMTGPDFSTWVRENKEFLALVEVWTEEDGWIARWVDGQWQ